MSPNPYKIRVLVVDDSSVVRNILSKELAKDPEIQVVGTACDPYVARDKILQLEPDVLTLDIEMPGMDGVTFLEKLMKARPMPVIIVSSLTASGCETTLRVLSLGAVDAVQKPVMDSPEKFAEMIEHLCEKIKAAHCSRTYVSNRAVGARTKTPEPIVMTPKMRLSDKIIAIGASTGGTEALRNLIPFFPEDFPPVVVAQHMPEKFTEAFAKSLNAISKVEVREASDQETLRPGLVLIAKGNYHTLLRRTGTRYFVEVKDGPLVCRQRPSVDVLFESVAKSAGKNAIGVILTGMGADGAQGLRSMREAGAYTIAQDEQSCVVYGMPKEAVKAEAVKRILPLQSILPDIARYLNSG